ncbi:hypothetical protein AAFF_G00376290 [Aldrovandia affinis]|uniref:XIAP-associated factor 1 C-terminal domain-containing protein n=1 Tax=Aldrovandia affinis TaxID=143900 RepID=A0AAD7SFY8_9TELE|nr:hypothetical protein AAFF_G00376290 [Aldrovandia affinis]
MEETQGGSQARGDRNEEVECQRLCPDCAEADPQERGEERGADQRRQSGECEGSLPSSEVVRREPRVGAPNHSHPHSPGAHRSPQRHAADPCWYCMTSLTAEALKKLQLDFHTLSLTPKGKHLSFQQDPRPHFGVARSSRSTPFPLWGYDGPLRRERLLEDTDRMSACPHCLLSLPLDTLQWHEAKCLVFEGLKNPSAK